MVDMTAPARPLALGGRQVWPPVVLAPMAGITNVAFRRLCREYGAGLYVSRDDHLARAGRAQRRDHADDRLRARTSRPRSLQLYGVDPATSCAARSGWSSRRTWPTTST